MNLSPALRETAECMAWELERERLRVTLAPSALDDIARRGGKIRVVAETNPGWYQQFCDDHAPSQRTRIRRKKKTDTIIKRQHTLRALREIANGRCRTEYARRLLPYVESEYRLLCRRYGGDLGHD